MSMGTARMASSLIELTKGTMLTPMTKPAESMLKPDRPGMISVSTGVTNSSAK